MSSGSERLAKHFEVWKLTQSCHGPSLFALLDSMQGQTGETEETVELRYRHRPSPKPGA